MDNLILNTIALTGAEDASKAADTVVFGDVIVKRDSNADGRLSEADAKQIAMSAAKGRGYRVLVAKAETLPGTTMLPAAVMPWICCDGTKPRLVSRANGENINRAWRLAGSSGERLRCAT